MKKMVKRQMKIDFPPTKDEDELAGSITAKVVAAFMDDSRQSVHNYKLRVQRIVLEEIMKFNREG